MAERERGQNRETEDDAERDHAERGPLATARTRRSRQAQRHHREYGGDRGPAQADGVRTEAAQREGGGREGEGEGEDPERGGAESRGQRYRALGSSVILISHGRR